MTVTHAAAAATTPPKQKAVHYTSLQNQPIEFNTIDQIKNKINLIYHVPSYFPLDSDTLISNLMYKAAAPIKRARSSNSGNGIKNNTLDESVHGLILTQREKDHLETLAQSCIYVETKHEMSTFEICDIFREYGDFKATKETENGFWVHLDLKEDEETI